MPKPQMLPEAVRSYLEDRAMVPTPRKERPPHPAGRWCEGGKHTTAKSATASERGFMLPGTTRWCERDQRWECRTHAKAHRSDRPLFLKYQEVEQ